MTPHTAYSTIISMKCSFQKHTLQTNTIFNFEAIHSTELIIHMVEHMVGLEFLSESVLSTNIITKLVKAT